MLQLDNNSDGVSAFAAALIADAILEEMSFAAFSLQILASRRRHSNSHEFRRIPCGWKASAQRLSRELRTVLSATPPCMSSFDIGAVT